MNGKKLGGFTLIELLIVVSIIAILAAIAVPNFLEAQTRSKVSAAKTNLRTGVIALEAYAVDSNRYPPTSPVIPGDPLGLLSDVQLRRLSTPIAYLSSAESLGDPFGTIQLRPRVPSPGTMKKSSPFPELSPPNRNKSLLYYHYPDLAVRYQNNLLAIFGTSLVSIGPDHRDSLGAFRPFDASIIDYYFGYTGICHPLDTVYDATNGTVSEGDICDFSGVARRAIW